MKAHHTLFVEPLQVRPGAGRRPTGKWHHEVHLATAMAVFTVLQIWAVTIVLTTVALEGLSGFALRIALAGTALGVVIGWRSVLRQRRR
jgi:hypothetical protein